MTIDDATPVLDRATLDALRQLNEPDQPDVLQEVLTLFFPSAAVFLVGVMYVAAGLIWPARPSVAFGAVFILLAAGAPYLGAPTHFLVFALVGSATFFAAAIAGAVHGRSPVGWAR